MVRPATIFGGVWKFLKAHVGNAELSLHEKAYHRIHFNYRFRVIATC
jgi:hypothetical protein